MSKAAVILAVVGAIVVHGIVLLFGGIIFLGEETHASKRDVELVSEEVQKDEEETVKEEEKQEVKQETEAPPDPNQSIKSVDTPSQSSDDAPALDAASLSAIEAALNGGGVAGGDFGAGAASLATGGRIGGTGKGGGEEQASEEAFSMSEIDQRPRPIQQVAGTFPQEMRSKSVEGVVTLIFIVDETGRVVNPRVEKASHPAFEAPRSRRCGSGSSSPPSRAASA
jgi:outer membrane biosynthesis protein TonB